MMLVMVMIMMMRIETHNSIALQCQSWYMGNKNVTRWHWTQSCLPDDDCQIEDGVTGYWWRHATITEIDLTNQLLSYFSILSTFIIIQSIFSMPHFEVANHTLKYINIKVGAVKFLKAKKMCHILFFLFPKKMETKHTTSLALNCRAQNNKVGQGYRSFRVPLSEAKLGHLGWHYLLAHPLCIWRSQNTTKLIYWLKRVEETLGCILFATGWMNSQKHIKCWTTIKLMKFLLSEFDITLLNLNEVCIQFY